MEIKVKVLQGIPVPETLWLEVLRVINLLDRDAHYSINVEIRGDDAYIQYTNTIVVPSNGSKLVGTGV